jgi:fibro-slime domain-containing protein
MVARGAIVAAASLLIVGCAEVKGHSDAGPSPGTAGTGLPPLSDGAAGQAGSSGSLIDALGAPPIDFKMADIGGYKLGPALASGASSNPGSGPKICNAIVGVVRDFKGALPAAGGTFEPGGHPDFEVFEGRAPTTRLVLPDLVDGKPVYASKCERGAPKSDTCPFGAMTTTAANFDQWYKSTDNLNKPYLVYFNLAAGEGGVPTFYSKHFFPVDGAGWGNSGIGKDDTGTKDVQRNFGFTTEVHTKFKYMGGEHFDFEGDDDVWVFINHKLAVDLGGLHFPEKGSVDLDAQAATLGIAKGATYDLDLFHAERHSIDSNFRIEMNFTFEDCGYVVP